ncbi:MAG: hypothetical protein AAF517_27140, partial [Planctomycetota bacterium]
ARDDYLFSAAVEDLEAGAAVTSGLAPGGGAGGGGFGGLRNELRESRRGRSRSSGSDRKESAKKSKRARPSRKNHARRAHELTHEIAHEEKAEAQSLSFGKGLRSKQAKFFQAPDPTREWAENNYFHVLNQNQNASLVNVNSFWSDYAAHGEGAFYSRNFPLATRNFTEMAFALSVLDLPFEAAEHESVVERRSARLKAGSTLVVFHKEVGSVEANATASSVLVSQKYFRSGDRYRMEGNQRVEKYVSGEFVTMQPYGGHVVVTNPTSARQKLEVLVEIPRGAIPLKNGVYTKSFRVDLLPYRTWTGEYYFYFPVAGDYGQFPVNVSREGQFLVAADPVDFHVVEKATEIDRESWDFVSQEGSDDEVIAYMGKHNLGRVALAKIAWRMKSRDFFRRTLGLLRDRHVYDGTLWSYGLFHDEKTASREYLRHANSFLARCGFSIQSELVSTDPVERKTYQHLEYSPLINARSHELGGRREVLNDKFHRQYAGFLRALAYQKEVSDADRISATYYLLLQDRVDEAIAQFDRIRPQRVPTRIQYDYLDAYLCFYRENLRRARTVANPYRDYPVKRWRQAFLAVIAQLDEIEGGPTQVVDTGKRDEVQTQLADKAPGVDFLIEG